MARGVSRPGAAAVLGIMLSLLGARSWAVDRDEVPLAPPGREGWRTLTFSKVPRATRYSPVEVDGLKAVRSESECSASALYLPLSGIDLGRTPRLTWRWKVVRGLTVPDERVQEGDDFAARVYVMFAFDPRGASLMQRLRHRLAGALYGKQVPANAMNYVWSSREPPGAQWDNPFASDSKMISLGHGALGEWRREEVDVAADYLSVFGRKPPPVLAVALMSDSDNSCQKAAAYFADFRFVGR